MVSFLSCGANCILVILYMGRRTLELVRAVAGIMLVAYVSGMILAIELGAKGILDVDTVHAVQSTLDVPTFLALVVFSALSIRLELFKPKYRLPARKRPLYDGMLIAAGIIITMSMLFLKYG